MNRIIWIAALISSVAFAQVPPFGSAPRTAPLTMPYMTTPSYLINNPIAAQPIGFPQGFGNFAPLGYSPSPFASAYGYNPLTSYNPYSYSPYTAAPQFPASPPYPTSPFGASPYSYNPYAPSPYSYSPYSSYTPFPSYLPFPQYSPYQNSYSPFSNLGFGNSSPYGGNPPICITCMLSAHHSSLDPIDLSPRTTTSEPDTYTEARATSYYPSSNPGYADALPPEGAASTSTGSYTLASSAQPRPIAPQPAPRPGVGPRIPDTPSPQQLAQIRPLNRDESRAQTAPIWNSFLANFQQCAPGCVPAQYASYGDRDNLSCHPTGQALDVHAMICPQAAAAHWKSAQCTHASCIYYAIDQGPFSEMVACMKTKMYVLWHNGPDKTEGHWDHAHFSNGCYVPTARGTVHVI